MSTDMNRRAILAGAAALPASALPAFGADDALIAIGEKMKPLVRPYFEASSKHEELSHQVDEPRHEPGGFRNDADRAGGTLEVGPSKDG
jgi:hypothetical protein